MVYFGRSCLRSGDYDNAERAFNSFLNAYPEHELVIEARLGKADIERARKNYDAALEMFREIVEPFDKQLRPEAQEILYAAECYIGIGKSLEAQGDDAGAIESYTRVNALYPADRFYPEALYLCAALFTRTGRFDKAEQYVNEIINDYSKSDFARNAIQLRDEIRQKKQAAEKKAG
jgi:TolA-binding protein